jgi:hypothetical protein
MVGLPGACRDFHLFQPGRAQFFRHPVRSALDIGFMFAFGTDARNAQKLFQLVQVFITP